MFKRKEFWGAVILVLGLWILLNNLDIIHYPTRHLFRDLWPLLLIIIGIALIFRKRRNKTTSMYDDVNIKIGNDSRTGHSHVFGDINIEARGMDIDGRSYSCVFGDISINLAGGILRSGANRLVIASTFGDVTIIVPSDMAASAYASSTMGDIYLFGKAASGFSAGLTASTEDYDSAPDKLQITASTTFGDIKIHQA
nr:hypothetical protein [candidate division Zixibacteria bacterium]